MAPQWFDAAAVAEKFGVGPERVVDVHADVCLAGCPVLEDHRLALRVLSGDHNAGREAGHDLAVAAVGDGSEGPGLDAALGRLGGLRLAAVRRSAGQQRHEHQRGDCA